MCIKKEEGDKWGYYDMSEGEERRSGNYFLTEGEEEGEERGERGREGNNKIKRKSGVGRGMR